jgi:hypothetical protein
MQTQAASTQSQQLHLSCMVLACMSHEALQFSTPVLSWLNSYIYNTSLMATHEHELVGYMSIRAAEQVCGVFMSIASSSKRRKHLQNT